MAKEMNVVVCYLVLPSNKGKLRRKKKKKRKKDAASLLALYAQA